MIRVNPTKNLRVGFDFDGVLVYNPARVARFPVALIKKIFLKPKRLKFWHPKTKWQKSLWSLAHKTSIFPATGYRRLLNLLRDGRIEGYVITARFSFLKDDFGAWFDKHDPDRLFADYYLNERDEQPHLFKERMIKELGLDCFVEDNWDIVNYLSRSLNSSESRIKNQESRSRGQSSIINRQSMTEIHWIYNILDRRIKYPKKYPYLGKFLEEVVMQ